MIGFLFNFYVPFLIDCFKKKNPQIRDSVESGIAWIQEVKQQPVSAAESKSDRLLKQMFRDPDLTKAAPRAIETALRSQVFEGILACYESVAKDHAGIRNKGRTSGDYGALDAARSKQ